MDLDYTNHLYSVIIERKVIFIDFRDEMFVRATVQDFKAFSVYKDV